MALGPSTNGPLSRYGRSPPTNFEIAMSSIVTTTLSIKVLATGPHGPSLHTTFIGTEYSLRNSCILRDPSDHKQVIRQGRVLWIWNLPTMACLGTCDMYHHQDPNQIILPAAADSVVDRERKKNSSPNLPRTLPEACRVVRISFLHCCTQYCTRANSWWSARAVVCTSDWGAQTLAKEN